MLTLCPGIDCPTAADCERYSRYRRRHEHPHATTYPTGRQPGKVINTAEAGAWPKWEWACDEFTKREVVTS